MSEITVHDKRDKIELWKNTFCKGATDDELELFFAVCKRTGLSPETRQIYLIKRYDSGLKKEVMAPQMSVDGLRIVAERSGKYAGQLGPYFTDDGKWTDVWLKRTPPAAAKVGVVRNDFKEPLWAVALYESYVQKTRDGVATSIWKKMPDVMLAKCAESLALRKAFPQELSGLYSEEEMQQAHVIEVKAIEAPKHAPTAEEMVQRIAPHLEALGYEHDEALFLRVAQAMRGKAKEDLPHVAEDIQNLMRDEKHD